MEFNKNIHLHPYNPWCQNNFLTLWYRCIIQACCQTASKIITFTYYYLSITLLRMLDKIFTSIWNITYRELWKDYSFSPWNSLKIFLSILRVPRHFINSLSQLWQSLLLKIQLCVLLGVKHHSQCFLTIHHKPNS